MQKKLNYELLNIMDFFLEKFKPKETITEKIQFGHSILSFIKNFYKNVLDQRCEFYIEQIKPNTVLCKNCDD